MTTTTTAKARPKDNVIEEFIKEVFEEQKATQRAIALNQSKLIQLEKKLDRILTREKRYVEVGYRA